MEVIFDPLAWGETGKVLAEGWLCSAQIKKTDGGYLLRAVAGNGTVMESPNLFASVVEARNHAPALCEQLVRTERTKDGYPET